jgi:uncharacterized protein YggT (Ycf19 family)
MRLIFQICVDVLIVALFLYSKLKPHQQNLTGTNKKVFDFCNTILSSLLRLLQRFAKPAQVGRGVAVDMSQIVLLILLLFILNFL